MNLEYELIVTDKDGKVIDRRAGECQSWLLAWLQLIYGCFKHENQTIKCTDGSDNVNDQQYPTLDTDGAATNDALGIVVGSGATAVTLSDYALETQIAHGVGGGQLQYGASSFDYPPALLAKQVYFKASRTFTNGSGAAVAVNEFGIYMDIGTGAFCCAVRDVLLNSVSIPDSGALTLTYRYRVEHTLP